MSEAASSSCSPIELLLLATADSVDKLVDEEIGLEVESDRPEKRTNDSGEIPSEGGGTHFYHYRGSTWSCPRRHLAETECSASGLIESEIQAEEWHCSCDRGGPLGR